MLIGGSDICNSKAVEHIKMLFILYEVGKIVDFLRIGYVSAHGGGGKVQMMGHKPGDKLGFVVGVIMYIAEAQGLFGAFLCVMPVSALGNIVQEGCGI